MPFTRVEVATLTVIEGSLHVLLALRAEDPHAGQWALPGGVLRIDRDASLEAAARRVMGERLGLEGLALRQLVATGGPSRDPRASWTLSVVYRSLVPAQSVSASPGKRIKDLRWYPVDDLKEPAPLAFDHARLVELAVEDVRAAVDQLELPFDFLPATFTLGELQLSCEQLLGHALDKSSFRRRLADRDLVEPVPGSMRGGAFRPAQVYRRKSAT